MSDNWPFVQTVGRLTGGDQVTKRVIVTSGCRVKIVLLLVEEGNGARVQQRIVRGTSDVTAMLTANFTGTLVAVIHVIGDESCVLFNDDTFRRGSP